MGAAVAQGVSLRDGPLVASRAALIALPQGGIVLDDAPVPVRASYGEAGPAQPGSLFAGRAAGSLFDMRPRDAPHPAITRRARGRDSKAAILDLIARAEAGAAGYDAVQLSARRKPPRKPTAMTLAEIDDWTRATPGQHHAIGRYQFIPKTLRRLTKIIGAPAQARFTPELQDQLAHVLLREAGYAKLKLGTIDRVTFMRNLAKIWAGLPTPSGRSHYHGHAGNRATITWEEFDAAMARIL